MIITKKNTRIIIVTLCVAVVAGLVYFQFNKQSTDISAVPKETVSNDVVGLSFTYPSSEKGFALVEPPVEAGGLLASYVLIPSNEYEDFKTATDVREAPASISVLVYTIDSATSTATNTERVDRITRLQNWAIDNDTLTSFTTAKATPDIVDIDGVKALHYQADGLYQQDIYVASYQNRAYMFTSQFDSSTDITATAFAEFIESISFD
jgi:hypothetical protein